MKEELFKRIDALAVKLGVTAQYLWGVLVKQAGVEGVKDLTFVGIFGLSALALALWARTCFKRSNLRKEGECGNYAENYVYNYDQRVNYEIDGWISAVVAGILMIPACILTSDAITALANPEYWAFQRVMEIFK